MIDKDSTLEETAFEVCSALHEESLKVVMVGGSAATYYAPAAYQSNDVDFVAVFIVDRDSEMKLIAVMKSLGYSLTGNTFLHTGGNPFTVEFPKGPLGVGGDSIHGYETRRKGDLLLNVISPTDSVRDRLSRYYFWDDPNALRAAVAIAREIPDQVDLKIVEEWSAREGMLVRFADFNRLLARKR